MGRRVLRTKTHNQVKLTNTQANQALLIDAIVAVYKVPIEMLNTRMRFREVVNARQMMFKVAYDHFGMTYSEIGRVLLPDRRKFDHSTVLYAKQTVDGYLKVGDENVVAKYKAVMSYISERTAMDATITISLKMDDVNKVVRFLHQHNLDYELTAHVQ